MRNNNFIVAFALLVGLSINSAHAQNTIAPPRLVLSILVDQLRSDYLQAFMPLFGDEGFKRLIAEGVVYHNVQYPFKRLDRASAVASFYSGCTPYENGVVGEKFMDRNSLKPVLSITDNDFDGVNTTTKASPRRLCVSNLADELKVNSDGKGLVFAISPYCDAAVYSAGHAANAAIWIDDVTGDWCTSSYYGGLPSWAEAIGRTFTVVDELKQAWEPQSVLAGNFDYFTNRAVREPFKIKIDTKSGYSLFKTSALINEYVGRMVTSCIQTSGVGLDAVPDLLTVTLYAGNYNHESINARPIEQQDVYVRLDRVISQIISEAEKKVGKENLLLLLTSTGYCDTDAGALTKYRVPTGVFSMVRAASLLNMYLCAVYGQNKWIETQYDNELFLNHKLIEEKGLNMSEILERSSDILIQMAGVQDVYTSQRLQLGAWTPGIKALRGSVNPKLSGDIILKIAPGWQIVNEDFNQTQYVRESYMAFPLIFWGADVVRDDVHTPIEIDRIAPTLADIIRIRAPNACNAAPLTSLKRSKK